MLKAFCLSVICASELLLIDISDALSNRTAAFGYRKSSSDLGYTPKNAKGFVQQGTVEHTIQIIFPNL